MGGLKGGWSFRAELGQQPYPSHPPVLGLYSLFIPRIALLTLNSLRERCSRSPKYMADSHSVDGALVIVMHLALRILNSSTQFKDSP